VEDIAEFCYEEGGKSYEYRIRIHDSSGNLITDPATGKTITDYELPCLEEPSAFAGIGAEEVKARQAEMARRRQLLEIRRQQLELESEERRLDAAAEPEDDPPPLLDEPDPYSWNPRWGPHPALMRMYGGKETTMKDMAAMMSVMMQPLTAALTAVVARKENSESDTLLKILPHIKTEQMGPKQMVDLFAPFVQQMGTMQSEATKAALGMFADMDSSFRERIMDFLMATDKPQDEIDKWRRALGLVKDGISEIGGSILMRTIGRPSIMDPKKKPGEAAVPKLAAPRPPGGNLTGPSPNPGTAHMAPQQPSAEGAPPDRKPMIPPVTSAQETAARVRRVSAERVAILLAATEEEMLVGSDASVVASRCAEHFLLMPLPIRAKIAAVVPKDGPFGGPHVGQIYEILREYDPERVAAILAVVEQDPTGQYREWCEDFWSAILLPEEEEEEENDGEGEDGANPEGAKA
jgi:hypothetical protein